jgi:predicted MFS family arabinose efflux permease
VFAILLFMITRSFLPQLDPPSGPQYRNSPAEIVRQYGRFLKIPSNLGALFSSLFTSAGITGFMSFLGVWLFDAFGIPGRKAGLVFLVSGAAALIASPFAGTLSDRIGKRRQFIYSCTAMAVILLILPNMSWGWPLFIVFGLISVAAAFRQGPMEAMLSEMASIEHRGTFIALKNSFSQLGIGLMALAAGILFEAGGYWAVCMLCAVSNILAVLCMLFTLQKRNL